MTWTKLGDEFLEYTEDLSAEAGWLHIQALVYSSRNLLDLHIPKYKWGRFAHTHDADVIDELIAFGMWRDDGDTYFIGLYRPEWQQERAYVEKERDRKAEDQRRRRLHNAGDHSRCHLASHCPTPGLPSPGDRSGDVPGYEPSHEVGDPGRAGSGRENPQGASPYVESGTGWLVDPDLFND